MIGSRTRTRIQEKIAEPFQRVTALVWLALSIAILALIVAAAHAR
jgi:hypothetical protein